MDPGKKMRLTMMVEKEEAPAFKEEDEEVRQVIYIVAQLKNSSVYSAAIFKLEIEIDEEVKAKDRFVVFNRKEYVGYESPPRLGDVSCDMVYNDLYLVCSYSKLGGKGGGQIRQAPVHIFDTVNERLFELSNSDRVVAPKPMPVVMAVGTQLYVYGQSVGTSLNVPLPTLESFSCGDLEWDSQLPPQFDLPKCTSVEGYAVINNFLLLSVEDFNGVISRNEFFYLNFSNSNCKWEKLILSKDVYYPFHGKAEFIDGVIYSCNGALSVYKVDSCSDEEGLHISPPQLVGFPKFASPPLDWSDSVYFSFCFAYMGIGKRFCIIKTGDSGCIGDQQYVAISVVEVSDDLRCLTTLTSTICPLNVSGLNSDLILNSCFVKKEVHMCLRRASSSQYNKTLKSKRVFPNISKERKKMRLTKMVEKEKPQLPITIKNPREARGVIYMVCQLKSSSVYSAAIFKLVMDMDEVNAERRFEVFNRRKYLGYESSPCLGSVSCGMVYNELYLLCTYSQLDLQGSQIRQAPVHLFDTLNERVIELPKTDRVTPKPFPIVMVVGNIDLLVYGQSAATSLNVPLPTLESFTVGVVKWQSQLPPQFDLPDCTNVVGYAVVNNFLLISVADFNGRNSHNEFFYWNFSGSNLKNSKWEKMILSKDQKTIYHPFSGKAEFIEGVIYFYNRGLYAYRVRSCSDENNLRISPPQLVGFPEFAAPPGDWSDSIHFSFCFSYTGIGKRFCIIKTGDSGCTPDQQYVAVCVVEVSDDLQCLTTLTSTICPLNISGLDSDLILTSCFVRMEGHKYFVRALQSGGGGGGGGGTSAGHV
ncbi:uncharacterized protein LOC132270667 [Cornus florida]|uniref:uncharacterized protein LOC132270667 n=1 Tax=Cornus florida TaxID=4283 RepID=UPI00289924C3|nr:uncharacterized protein LOC132270667 [Cornus florida]